MPGSVLVSGPFSVRLWTPASAAHTGNASEEYMARKPSRPLWRGPLVHDVRPRTLGMRRYGDPRSFLSSLREVPRSKGKHSITDPLSSRTPRATFPPPSFEPLRVRLVPLGEGAFCRSSTIFPLSTSRLSAPPPSTRSAYAGCPSRGRPFISHPPSSRSLREAHPLLSSYPPAQFGYSYGGGPFVPHTAPCDAPCATCPHPPFLTYFLLCSRVSA